MPTVRVLFFAKSREVSGVAEQAFTLSDADANTTALVAALLVAHPGLAGVMRSCVLALNQEYLEQDACVPLKEGDEVAIIPPLSGG